MNVWCFSGNLGSDCEQRFTPSGESVVSFSVGVKSGYGDKATTTWARCQMWGKRGESVMAFLLKGQLVGITGEVTLREYDDKQGNKCSSLDVRVNDLTLLGKRDGASEPRQQATARKPAAAPVADYGFDDSDAPF